MRRVELYNGNEMQTPFPSDNAFKKRTCTTRLSAWCMACGRGLVGQATTRFSSSAGTPLAYYCDSLRTTYVIARQSSPDFILYLGCRGT